MKKILFILAVVLIGGVWVFGQASPVPKPESDAQRREREYDDRVVRLRNKDKPVKVEDNAIYLNFLHTKIKPLYRDPTSEEQVLLEPSAEDKAKYAAVLNQKDTGLSRLIMDRGCDADPEVINSNSHCQKYTMPGAGSSYSFREETYRWRHLADLTYSNNRLQTVGLLVQGIFVDIGQVPLDQMTLQSPGLKFLTEYEPSDDLKEAIKFDEELAKGIEKDNFTYQRSLPVYDNTTYVLRAIAYRGEAPRTVEDVTYNEFDFDKRRDVIVAFRVVSYQSGEGITILWKILDEKKSPKIKIETK